MELIYAILRASAGLALVVALTRMNGLRTFSKMSGFDFALTLAVGSTLASVAMADGWTPFIAAMAALVALYALQFGLSRARRHWAPLRREVDNAPLLLMEHGEIFHDNLSRGNVTRADLMAKLREANAFSLSDVRAVVLETTGDVSVLHGHADVDDVLLDGVRRS